MSVDLSNVTRGGVQSVDVSRLHWFYNRNPRKDEILFDAGLDVLARSFLKAGWETSLGVVYVRPLSANDLILANAERSNMWNSLKQAAIGGKIEAINTLKAFEDLYCENPGTDNSKLIALTENDFEAFVCYRRSKALMRAAYLVHAGGKGKENYGSNEPIPETFKKFPIPVDVFIGLSDEDLYALQIRENEGKTDGAKPLTFTDRLFAAVRFFQLGNSQAYFRRTFKDGTGQKLFGICSVNSKYDLVNLLDRVWAALGRKPNGDPDPAAADGPVNKVEGKWLYTNNTCPVPQEKLNQVDLNKFARGEHDKYGNSDDGVEDYIKDSMTGTGTKAQPSMPVEQVRVSKDRVSTAMAKLVYDTVLNNSRDPLSKIELQPMAKDVLNAAFYLVKYGHGVEAAEALAPLRKKYDDEIRAGEKAEKEVATVSQEAAHTIAEISGDKAVEGEIIAESVESETAADEHALDQEAMVEEPEVAVQGDEAEKPHKGRKGGRRS